MSDRAPLPQTAPAAYPGGYVQTAPGAPPVPVAAPAPRPSGSPRLGVVALVIALVAVVGGGMLSATTGFAAAADAMARAVVRSPSGLENLTGDELLALLSPVRGLVLWAEIGFWAATVLGVWALVQGIVAIATRRGRGAGIAAVILAAAGPVLFAVIVGSAVLAGMAAGA